MKTTYCNPLDLGYRYQHVKEGPRVCGFREGADPTLVLFKDVYYLFVSMSAGFWYSADLLDWKFHPDENLLIYDYAPDVRQIGNKLYFCASRREDACPILCTEDPLHQPFRPVAKPFPFWDPNLFCDEDGRVYFYWGCSSSEPLYGVELDAETLLPVGEKQALIFGREEHLGYERPGENGVVNKEKNIAYQRLKGMFNPATNRIEFPAGMEKLGNYTAEAMTKIFLSIGKPYVEGAFMTRHKGRYYLQYAAPGTEYNTYCDGVYVGEHPLGPFTLQTSNPFSAKPGGFAAGAGHGSTIADRFGNYWHASTMRISVNHDFERRVGLFPAGFDEDGFLFCNQNFADYPHKIPQGPFDARNQQPEWMLLSYHKPVSASSTAPDSRPDLAVDENIRTWWSAATAEPGQWIMVDLEKECDVRAVQVNLADQELRVEFPPDSYGDARHTRHIELRPQISRYTVEYSRDGRVWELLEEVERECSNGYGEYRQGIRARYIRVTAQQLPYGQVLRVSGLRVFGNGEGEKPPRAVARGERITPLDARISWQPVEGAQGCNVRYGTAPDKLYHSWLVYDAREVTLSTLIAGQKYFVCVDSFNENGITPGEVFAL